MQVSDNPQDYKLPAKFKQFYPYQKELIEFVLNSPKKFVVLAAPTGIGKTVVAMTLANIMNCRTYYVCSTKALQDQIETEFGGMGVRTIRGKDNFGCVIENNAVTAAECKFEALTGKARDCPAYKICGYFKQRDEAQKTRIVCFNYAYAITAWNYTQSWSRAGLLILDETDQAEGWLSNMVKIRFSYRDFTDYDLQFPGPSQDEVKIMIAELGLKVGERLGELKKKDVNTISREEQVALKRVKNLARRLEFFQTTYEENWLFKHETKRDKRFWHVEFEPVWAKKFGQMLWGHGDRVVFMSATPGSKEEFCFKLGLNPEEVDYIEVPSPFPVENRRVIYMPVGNLSMKYYERNRPNMLLAIDNIIGERLDQKGIIHTPSYQMANDIAHMSRYNPYMILVGQEDNKTEILQKFKKSAPPRILVSPVHGRGIDLPDEDARYAIIPKVLWPDLGDEKVKRRLADRESWYSAQAVDAIVQAAGRIVRSASDWGSTYILDTQFRRLLYTKQELFPLWFIEALFEMDGHRKTDDEITEPETSKP